VAIANVRALLFDVFGTVVDRRGGVAREAAPFLRRHAAGVVDPLAFADGWRAAYQTSMEEVRSGRRSFVRLDVLHRENLEAVLNEFGIAGLTSRRQPPAQTPNWLCRCCGLSWCRSRSDRW
jgi:2-haloacid dehalogenase